MTRTILLSAILAAAVGAPDIAVAAPPDASTPAATSPERQTQGPLASAAIRHAAANGLAAQPGVTQAPSPGRKGRAARKTIGAIAGGVGGFFLGGVLGAKLEPDCNCDDPGLKGVLIGAPIGAVAGALLGSMVD